MTETRERRRYLVLDVPELDFIPQEDRFGESTSPEGTLTNKIFKYINDETRGRVLYTRLLDIYGIDSLVVEYDARMPMEAQLKRSKKRHQPKQLTLGLQVPWDVSRYPD